MLKTTPKRFLLSLEGIIGAGKTSVFDCLNEGNECEFFFNFIDEPVDKFSKYKHFNPLLKSYLFPTSDAAIAQIHFSKVIAENFKAKYNNSSVVNVCDRSCDSPSIFIQTYRDLGFFSNFVGDYVTELCQDIMSDIPLPHFIVYLDIDVHKAMERIKQRNREEENFCTVKQQIVLKENYEKYLTMSEEKGAIVKRINVDDKDIMSIAIEVQDFILEQEEFLEQINAETSVS